MRRIVAFQPNSADFDSKQCGPNVRLYQVCNFFVPVLSTGAFLRRCYNIGSFVFNLHLNSASRKLTLNFNGRGLLKLARNSELKSSTFNSNSDTTLALCLSGGGLRATFFHFGVVKALAEAGRLETVTDIIAVSGGSILAGHMIKNWEAYAGPNPDLARMEKELRALSGRGMRERVVRRYLTTGFGYLSKYIQSRAIQGEYARILGHGSIANCYRENSNRTRMPKVHFMCTNFNSGEACCFTEDQFIIYRKPPNSIVDTQDGGGQQPAKTVKMAVSSDTIELTFAVAASSAFPGLFPPVKLDAMTLGASARDFPVTVYLSDGGIYDNLGLEHFAGLVRHTSNRAKEVLVSNASGAFQWNNTSDYYGIFPRNLRTIDILMNLMIEERWDRTSDYLRERGIQLLRADIGTAGWLDGAPPVSVQQQIQNIRTDLDRFSADEIDLLIEHGYRTALEQSGITPRAPRVSASQLLADAPSPTSRFRFLDQLVKQAAHRKPGLFDWRDPAWSLGVGLGLAMLCFTLFLPVLTPVAIYKWFEAEKKWEDEKRESAREKEKVADLRQRLSSATEQLNSFNSEQLAAAKARAANSFPPAAAPASGPEISMLNDRIAKLEELDKEIKFDGSGGKEIGGTQPQQNPFKPTDKLLEFNRSSYKIWLQFAGSFKREEMVDFGTKLVADWPNAPGAKQGGERTSNAVGLLEVRYGTDADQQAAETLTNDILNLKIVPKMNKPRKVGIIPKNSLEIWISK